MTLVICPVTQKKCFASPTEAEKRRRLFRKRKRGVDNDKARMQPYRCQHCRRWHLGHGT